MTYTFDIIPMGKPRMTRSDKWRQRKCVLEYRAFADELRRQASFQHFALPDQYTAICILPMPDSWSKKKRAAMLAQPHQQKPDKDNLEKALCDALRKDDERIWDSRVIKFWGETGKIIIDIRDQ